MVVQVRLFATLRENRFKNKELEFAEGSSLGDLLLHLHIAAEQVGILLQNGRNASAESKLAPNDVVSIFPALGGG
jgi:molybdopterin converting factor small subunit